MSSSTDIKQAYLFYSKIYQWEVFNVNLRERFVNECENMIGDPKCLVVAISLPSGATEIITNTEHIGKKVDYYLNLYDDDFCLKTNSEVKIINFMLI